MSVSVMHVMWVKCQSCDSLLLELCQQVQGSIVHDVTVHVHSHVCLKLMFLSVQLATSTVPSHKN